MKKEDIMENVKLRNETLFNWNEFKKELNNDSMVVKKYLNDVFCKIEANDAFGRILLEDNSDFNETNFNIEIDDCEGFKLYHIVLPNADKFQSKIGNIIISERDNYPRYFIIKSIDDKKYGIFEWLINAKYEVILLDTRRIIKNTEDDEWIFSLMNILKPLML